jgi:hypothetical protein
MINFCPITNSLGYEEKQCAAAFWNGKLEEELRELGRLDYFGLLKKDDDRDKVTEEIDKYRAKSVYRHLQEDCSDACKARGKMRKKLFVSYIVFNIYSHI